MGRFVTPAIILQVILTALLSSVFTSLGGSISWSFLGSTALSTSPVSDSLLLPEGLGYFHFEDYAYEFTSALDATQGLAASHTQGYVLFNPGADVDLTTTTDFEDLAGPAADILEFGDQDRALLSDSMSSVVF
jgi:hypothetical protein